MTRTLTRAECPCLACGWLTTARQTIEGTTQLRECPNRRCSRVLSAVLAVEQSSGNEGGENR